MTKTYNDIEAVTRLLEEKESDLELAARIGQTLLSKNKEVSSRAESLEEQLAAANDKVQQLRHDLALKDELLRIFNEDLEHDPGATSLESSGLNPENVVVLEKKVKALEEENLHLKLEGAQLKSDTDSYEEKEKKLVEDCISQIGDLNHQVESLADELNLKALENVQHKDEVTMYLAQVTNLQRKIRTLTTENMDMHERLTHSVDSQRRLTNELSQMQDRYDELFELLEEAQEDVRRLKVRQKHAVTDMHLAENSADTVNSLASELEASLQQQSDLKEQIEQKEQQIEQHIEQSQQLQIEQSQQLQIDNTSSITNTAIADCSTTTAIDCSSNISRREKSWKIFETTRAAKRAAAANALEKEKSPHAVRMSVTESPSLLQRKDNDTTSLKFSDTASLASADNLSICSEPASQYSSEQLSTVHPYDLSFDSVNSDIDCLYSSNPELGRPGIPGSNDLESALRRLAIRHANALNERDFLEEQRKKYLQMSYRTSGLSSPFNLSSSINTPPSVGSASADSKSSYKRSDKLQIVKPLEGSMTLKHWQQLASPNLSGIFESREGVQMKSEKPAKPKEELDSFDLEGDETQDIHTRRQHDSGMIYTFTDSTIGHMGSSNKLNPLFQTRSSPANQSLSLSEGPIHCSTPKQPYSGERQAYSGERQGMGDHPRDNNSFSAEKPGMPLMSLGLASVLNNNENVLLRSSPNIQMSESAPLAPSQPLEQMPQDSGPEHLLPIPSNSSLSALSRSRNLPGSRSFEQMMQESDERGKSETAVMTVPQRRELLTPGMTGQGLIQQLKSKGFYLYGLWGSGNKEGGQSSSKASDVDVNYSFSKGAESSDPKASDVDVSDSFSKESSPEKTYSSIGGLGVLGAISKTGRNKDL